MYEKLLLPTDGSDTAALATLRAVELARQFDATLHGLYVVETTRESPELTGREEHVAEQIAEAESIMEDLQERAADAEIEVETCVRRDVPRSTIESYAAERDVDLIVIGSVGASGVSEKLLGTVAKYVVNEAPADVLVVRPDERV